jgi:NDP-sugar pyrophosphorylase family protein
VFENGVILAAGRGIRMRPFSDETPKPLLPSLEHCLLGHQIDFIRPFVRNLHVTTSYLADQIFEYAVARQVDNIINTQGGGNASWINHGNFSQTKTSILVITSDNLMNVDLSALYDESQNNQEMSLIVPIAMPEEKPGDRILLDDKNVVSIDPKNKSLLLASGLQVINPYIASQVSESTDDFGQIWKSLISNQKLSISELRPIEWFALDTPEELDEWSNATRSVQLDKME